MAHIQKPYSKLYRPEDNTNLISSKKMFMDNIDQQEANFVDLSSRIASQVANVQALRAFNTLDINLFIDGCLVSCASNGWIYRFVRNSVAADNGTSIITPTTGTGRWICTSSSVADNAIPKTEKAAADGVAPLNTNKKVPDEHIDINIARRNGVLQTNLNVEMIDGRTWPEIIQEMDDRAGEGKYNDLNMVFTHELGKYPEAYVVYIPPAVMPEVDPDNPGYGLMEYASLYDGYGAYPDICVVPTNSSLAPMIDPSNLGYGQMEYGSLDDGYGGYKLMEATSVPCKVYYISDNALSVLVRANVSGIPSIQYMEENECVLLYPDGSHYYIRLGAAGTNITTPIGESILNTIVAIQDNIVSLRNDLDDHVATTNTSIKNLNDEMQSLRGIVFSASLEPINLVAIPSSNQVTLTWQDPNDIVVSGKVEFKWVSTMIRRKRDTYPIDESDGELVVNNTVQNMYANDGFVDSNLDGNVRYYYQAFIYSITGTINRDEANRVNSVPKPPYKIYGIRIDETNPNPETAVEYTDDAIGMIPGSTAWDETGLFKNIRPCLLHYTEGFNGYLNPNNFAQFENGSTANITSGTVSGGGDVMIEIPKMAYAIYREDNYLYVKATDYQNIKAFDNRFCFYAHTRATEGDRDKLYVGAYLSYISGTAPTTTMYSISGKAPTGADSLINWSAYARYKGAGYDVLSFYAFTLLQCLFLIRYKNLSSKDALGVGVLTGSIGTTGTTNTKGMYYGSQVTTESVKFCGIEDIYGRQRAVIDGLRIKGANGNIVTSTAFKDFHLDASYNARAGAPVSTMNGHMSKPVGTNELGFRPLELNGSSTTYYCGVSSNNASASGKGIVETGGAYDSGTSNGWGVISFNSQDSDYTMMASRGSRLMYL